MATKGPADSRREGSEPRAACNPAIAAVVPTAGSAAAKPGNTVSRSNRSAAETIAAKPPAMRSALTANSNGDFDALGTLEPTSDSSAPSPNYQARNGIV